MLLLVMLVCHWMLLTLKHKNEGLWYFCGILHAVKLLHVTLKHLSSMCTIVFITYFVITSDVNMKMSLCHLSCRV